MPDPNLVIGEESSPYDPELLNDELEAQIQQTVIGVLRYKLRAGGVQFTEDQITTEVLDTSYPKLKKFRAEVRL